MQREIQLYLAGASSWYINTTAWPHTAIAFNKQWKHLELQQQLPIWKDSRAKNICKRCKPVIDPNSAGNSISAPAPVCTWPFIHPKSSVDTHWLWLIEDAKHQLWRFWSLFLCVFVLFNTRVYFSLAVPWETHLWKHSTIQKSPVSCWKLYCYMDGKICLSQIKKFPNYSTWHISPCLHRCFYFYGIFLDIKKKVQIDFPVSTV